MADSAMCWSGVAAPAKAIVRLTFPNHGHSRKSRSCCFNEFRDTLKGDATEGTFNPQKGTCPGTSSASPAALAVLAIQKASPSTTHSPSIHSQQWPHQSSASVSAVLLILMLFVRSANPGRLVGRQAERDELTRFIQNAVSSKRGGCMYVSGPPGTGKSALVEEVCRELQPRITAKAAYVNCASMTSARDIYRKLVEDLCGESQVFKKSEAERLRGMFLPKKKSCSDIFLVALDEIDHLLTGDQEILYNFFEWSLQTNSRLVLIGIANALDLTDRFLPRLKAKNLKPQLLPFLPYTPAQITNSLLLDDAAVAKGFVPFLHPAAIQFCARKVASQSGDLRKAFDLVRRTIELIEREPKQKFDGVPAISSKPPLLENMNLASPLSPPDTPEPVSRYTAATAPRATVAHVARVTSAAFGHGTTERLQGLNLHQKATLCALISAGRKRRATFNGSNTPTKSPRSTAPTVKELFDTYSSLCRRDNVLQPLSITEFKDIIGSLETMGLVGEAQTRVPRRCRHG
ncbi:cell division control protein 6 [Coccidioides immitis RMSCC 3703]|uniref:Cell division control protein n=1 Tax=Coccidioides immitis RMSCC 3703 TaxID=454286 RepID=A0A0J8R762_COCIT|nr:cell division control protein 6 [Coccidioides immitis RMSCC 3703]